MKDTNYSPAPIEVDRISLSDEILALTEKLAENNHDLWAQKRLAEGWKYGPIANGSLKETPFLVPYSCLSEMEKGLDRQMVLSVLKATIALGFSIESRECDR